MTEEIKQTIRHLPNQPGIYMYKDAHGTILYVGKAKELKKRVSSYFSKKQTDRPWINIMLPLIASVETIVVNNEVEALMLESTLIKQHRPKYNILLTDDKAYPYIKLVTKELFPRFFVTRTRNNDGARYFGPYLSARSANYTLEFLRKIYGIHINNRPLRTNQDRACLYCQMNNFTCPQNGEVSSEKYQERVSAAIAFLEGKRKTLAHDLEERMIDAAQRQEFELAAKLRDRLQGIQHVLSRQQVVSTTTDDYDAIGGYTVTDRGAISVLFVREGRVTGQKTYYYDVPDSDTASMVEQFLTSYYATYASTPNLVVISEAIESQSAVEQLLSETYGHTVTIRLAERGDKRQVAELAQKNAQTKLEELLVKTDQSTYAVHELQKILGLSLLPRRIEAVDISNLGTSEPVSATVCFINGRPDKNEYRRYKIKTVEGQNDFAMIQEVTTRRFSDRSRPVPDLFVVDGGPQQLEFALRGLAAAPLKPGAIISLAKKPDRIFLPNKKRPLLISRANKGLLLLAQIRDEVHRFGISFQRSRQRKKLLNSSNP